MFGFWRGTKKLPNAKSIDNLRARSKKARHQKAAQCERGLRVSTTQYSSNYRLIFH